MIKRPRSIIHIKRAPLIAQNYSSRGLMEFEGSVFRCVLGEASVSTRKKEGDLATPAGKYALIEGFWRQDRMRRPDTNLKMTAITQNDGWCDDLSSPIYNQNFNLSDYKSKPPSHEELWRDDPIYDIVLVIDHNTHPRIRGRGSAIFIHLQRPDKSPTQGCIALSLVDMKHLLRRIRSHTTIFIHQ